LIARSVDLFERMDTQDALVRDPKQALAEMTRQQVTGA